MSGTNDGHGHGFAGVSGTGGGATLAFRVLGTPIRVSPWFWVVGVILGYPALQAGAEFLAAWLVVLFASILVHELGHALVARRFGYSPGILLYQFGGLASYRPDASHTAGRALAISLAGPGAGFVLLGVVLALRATVLPQAASPTGPDLLRFTVGSLIWINLWWGLMNLLPVVPLDGGQVCRVICHLLSPRRGITWSQGIGAVTGGVAAVALFASGYMYAALLFGLLALGNVSALRGGGEVAG
jgi:stage IV sporulation protein FB